MLERRKEFDGLLGPESAVEPDRERMAVSYADGESLKRLARQQATALGESGRHHQWQFESGRGPDLKQCRYGRLGVESVEYGFKQYEVSARFGEGSDLLPVCAAQGVEVDIALLGGHRQRYAGRPYVAGYPCLASASADGSPRCPHCLAAYVGHEVGGAVAGQRNGVGVECVGGDDVGAGLEILHMYIFDSLGRGETEKVDTSGLGAGFLQHCPHGPVEREHALPECFVYIV